METIRHDAVLRVRAGEDVSSVLRSYGMARTTFYKWIKRMAEGDGTMRSLKMRRAPGGQCRLTPQQKAQVRKWIVGHDPRQYGFDFGLWTRQLVSALIAQRFNVTYSVAAVGQLLKELEITPQKPLTRAWQRDPRAVSRWKRERFPKLQAEAKATGAEIFFLDESGFRADAQMGRTWGRKGRTPVVARDGRRPRVNVLGMVTARGAFYYRVFTGKFTAPAFIDFLKTFLRALRRPAIIVLDSHPVHASAAVSDYVAQTEGLRLEFLPAYAPELNPQEQAWRWAKRTGTARTPLRKGENFQQRIEQDMRGLKRRPRLIRSFYEHKDTRYIVDSARVA